MVLADKVKNAIERKTQNMKMTKGNMQLLTELENKVISIYRDPFFGTACIVFIIDDNQKVIHQDDGDSDPYTQTYQEYIDTLYMNLAAPGGTVYKDNHEMMTEEEYVERSLRLLDEVKLEYYPETLENTTILDRMEEMGHSYYRRHTVSKETIRKLVPLCIIANENGTYNFNYKKFINLMPIDELLGILEIQRLSLYDDNDCCDFFADNTLPCCIDWEILEATFEKHTGQEKPTNEWWAYNMYCELEKLYMKFIKEFFDEEVEII